MPEPYDNAVASWMYQQAARQKVRPCAHEFCSAGVVVPDTHCPRHATTHNQEQP